MRGKGGGFPGWGAFRTKGGAVRQDLQDRSDSFPRFRMTGGEFSSSPAVDLKNRGYPGGLFGGSLLFLFCRQLTSSFRNYVPDYGEFLEPEEEQGVEQPPPNRKITRERGLGNLEKVFGFQPAQGYPGVTGTPLYH